MFLIYVVNWTGHTQSRVLLNLLYGNTSWDAFMRLKRVNLSFACLVGNAPLKIHLCF